MSTAVPQEFQLGMTKEILDRCDITSLGARDAGIASARKGVVNAAEGADTDGTSLAVAVHIAFGGALAGVDTTVSRAVADAKIGHHAMSLRSEHFAIMVLECSSFSPIGVTSIRDE